MKHIYAKTPLRRTRTFLLDIYMNIQTVKWASIKDIFKDGSLITGNGASIEIHEYFNYRNLYDSALNNKLISDSAASIFSALSTTNFEVTLKDLARSAVICDLLEEQSAYENIISKYNEIRQALYSTVHNIHPLIASEEEFNYFATSKKLENKVLFLQQFRTIINLNYDVILYWITIWAMKSFDAAKRDGSSTNFNTIFKDCFIHQDEESSGLLFDSNPLHLRENILNDRRNVTLIFYPHGNIILTNDVYDDRPIKIRTNFGLLETINDEWIGGKVTPLIVCEGDAKSKLKSIESNPYTGFVFNDILPNLNNTNITILGWSMDKSDQHILRQILRNEPKAIAISYHGSPDSHKIQQRIQITWDDLFKNDDKLNVAYPNIYLFPSKEIWSVN